MKTSDDTEGSMEAIGLSKLVALVAYHLRGHKLNIREVKYAV